MKDNIRYKIQIYSMEEQNFYSLQYLKLLALLSLWSFSSLNRSA